MSAKAGKRPLRSLTAQEKLEAIRRVHNGESKASVARDIGVPESTLRGWCKNEDKISYLSRQSTPDTDDSGPGGDIKEKKAKLDDSLQPYNLSMKAGAGTCSPISDTAKYATDFIKIDYDKPLNLNNKHDAVSASHITERERNRAELARLRLTLGLNRPEMFLSNLATTNNTASADLPNSLEYLTQWNNLLLQQQKSCNLTVTAPADTSSAAAYSAPLHPSPPSDKEHKPKAKLPKAEKTPSLDESVWYWLKTQQAMYSLMQNQNATPATSSPSVPCTSSASVTSSSHNQSNGTAAGADQSSWFWKWYKQFAGPYGQQIQPAAAEKPILYQQLTKDKDVTNSENLTSGADDRPSSKNGTSSSTKARAALDNLLLNNNNNNNVAPNKKDAKEDTLSQSEALEHGEKFLEWLECCSEPCVTAMQIMQFRYLLNNIKSGADRKNGETMNKIKLKRK